MQDLIPFLKRITDDHREDFHNRRISAKALSKTYGVTAKYVRTSLPLRPPQLPAKQQKQALAHIRRMYRMDLARKVHESLLTVKQACTQAHCSERNMFRYLAKHRKNA
jgi:hypothetical protein